MQPAAGPPPPGVAAVAPLRAANRTIAGVEWNIREGACNPPSSGYSIGSGLVLRTFIRGLTLQTTLTLCLTQTPLLNHASAEAVSTSPLAFGSLRQFSYLLRPRPLWVCWVDALLRAPLVSVETGCNIVRVWEVSLRHNLREHRNKLQILRWAAVDVCVEVAAQCCHLPPLCNITREPPKLTQMVLVVRG